MIKPFSTALVAALAAAPAAAQQDAFLLDQLTEGRQLSGWGGSMIAPNANIVDEQGCIELNANTSSAYYFYDWNVDGCYCSHMWQKSHQYYDYYSWCATGFVLNPRHIPGYQPDRCITKEDFADNTDYAACPPPEPTCEDNFVVDAGAPSKGYASAVLKGNGASGDVDDKYSSGFETGFVIFEEMCGGSCEPFDHSKGDDAADTPCYGICVTGNFWGLQYSDTDKMPNESGLHIHEFAVACAELPSGCAQTGDIHGPLGNVEHSPAGQCNASGFRYCAKAGDFALSGPRSIVGKSVVLHSMQDEGNAALPESPIYACGTITQDHLNPAMNLIPFGATAYSEDGPGTACPDSPASPSTDDPVVAQMNEDICEGQDCSWEGGQCRCGAECPTGFCVDDGTQCPCEVCSELDQATCGMNLSVCKSDYSLYGLGCTQITNCSAVANSMACNDAEDCFSSDQTDGCVLKCSAIQDLITCISTRDCRFDPECRDPPIDPLIDPCPGLTELECFNLLP